MDHQDSHRRPKLYTFERPGIPLQETRDLIQSKLTFGTRLQMYPWVVYMLE